MDFPLRADLLSICYYEIMKVTFCLFIRLKFVFNSQRKIKPVKYVTQILRIFHLLTISENMYQYHPCGYGFVKFSFFLHEFRNDIFYVMFLMCKSPNCYDLYQMTLYVNKNTLSFSPIQSIHTKTHFQRPIRQFSYYVSIACQNSLIPLSLVCIRTCLLKRTKLDLHFNLHCEFFLLLNQTVPYNML